MQAEKAAEVIELKSQLGPRRKRRGSMGLVSELITSDPELLDLADRIAKLKQIQKRNAEEMETLKEQVRELSYDLKGSLAAKGKRINRVQVVDPEEPGKVKLEFILKNQFRPIDVADYPALCPAIGADAYDEFIEEDWVVKPVPGFCEGEFMDAVILGIEELMGNTKIACEIADFCWNTIESWLTFDVRLKVKNKDFDHRLHLWRHKMSPSQRAAMQDFVTFARYKGAVN